MRKDFLPFSQPSITEADIQAVGDVLRSGWITTGAHAAKFEEEFAAYVGARHAVALASATGGMHVVLKALGIGPGDEVVTPSMTWASTVNLIVLAGAKPVFADVDRDTLMVGAPQIAAVLSSRTKLIIPVHFAGAPANMDPIRQLATARGIPIVEDAAHAAGTAYRSRHIGTIGTAIFSFHPIKNMTSGEGGMVCTDDMVIFDAVRRLKFHGLGVDAFDRAMQGRSPQAEVVDPGFKYNMTDIAAVLGRRQLTRLDEFNRKRAELAQYYRQRLSEVEEILPLKDPTYPMQHAWHLFIARLDIDLAGMSRDMFMDTLKQKNIGTGLHFRAVHLQKYYREKMGCARGMLPYTEWNSDRICSLPLFPNMQPEDVDDVVAAIKEVL